MAAASRSYELASLPATRPRASAAVVEPACVRWNQRTKSSSSAPSTAASITECGRSPTCAELITGRDHPWAKVYDPKRTSLWALGTLLKESLESTLPYSAWLKGGDVKSAREIAPGSGELVRQGLHLLAVYRDPDGACHARSAACPHLGGVVQWNPAERSWDWPCHGSRFDAHGKVLAGPANSDLPPAALDDDTGADRKPETD